MIPEEARQDAENYLPRKAGLGRHSIEGREIKRGEIKRGDGSIARPDSRSRDGSSTLAGFRRDWFFELCKLRRLLFRGYLQPSSRPAQRCDLACSELAKLARGNVKPESTIANAADLLDVMADLLEHLTDLAVPPFGKGEFKPGIVASPDLLDLCRSGDNAIAPAAPNLVEAASVDHNAAAKLVDALCRRYTRDLDQVGLLHSRCGLGELVGKIAIVGHQQKALGEVIEAADRIQTDAVPMRTLLLSHQLHHSGPLLGVRESRDVSPGLVEHVIALLLTTMQ
jgi:hypothetical protein